VLEKANARTFLFPQIETVQAVENLDAILAVAGLAGILIGPGDLSATLGCPGDMDNERLIDMVADCTRRARAAGKHAAIFSPPGPLLDAALDAGCDLAFLGSDMGTLSQSLPKLLAQVPSEPRA